MRLFITVTVESIVSGARRLVHIGASADSRRLAFSQEFGQYPPYQEASPLEREQFAQEVVDPVLTKRAQAVQDSRHESVAGALDQPQRDAYEAFVRAHQVAVDMGLARKDQVHRDYLGPQR